MADAAIMLPANGAASFTVDPANSATQGLTLAARRFIEGPPLSGAGFALSRWIVQLPGTQANSNSLTAIQYRWMGDEPSGAASPTNFNYVATL